MRGKLQHVTFDQTMVDEDMFEEGTMFDGSSIAGWKAINESDMVLMPDPELGLHGPVLRRLDAGHQLRHSRAADLPALQPRPAHHGQEGRGLREATRASATASISAPSPSSSSSTTCATRTPPTRSASRSTHSELPSNNDTDYEGGNNGHHIGLKKGYFPVPPLDSAQDMRGEMLAAMGEMGVPIEKHHHEVASAQHELGIKFCPIIKAADSVQIYKYVIHQVANAYGKTATFMPKPVYGDNGSGMHCHQSIWKDGKPLFAGDQYAGLSMDALYYIGGIIKHAKAINAFTNPTTNSYKRLVPGFEAPVLLAYSARNRSASCRIPFGQSPKAKRVEVRFPDPLANPYLGFAAMLMAGIDGIKNKIHPGEPMDKDLYELPKEELKQIPTVCGSLREALESLDKDRDFLKAGGVFDDDQIDSYIELKMTEVIKFEHTPHPVEYEMYYSA